MTDGRICDNKANNFGGGIYVWSSSVCNISGGEISGNTAVNSNTSWGGGGIYASSRTTLNITGGIITGNTTGSVGGGIRVDGNSTASVTGGLVYGNQWAWGKSDVYAAKGAKLTLMSASSMKPKDYNCWYDLDTYQTYNENIESDSLEQTYHIYAKYIKNQSADAAAQILDENGTWQNYSSISEAVKAATEGQRIYLLKDCEESVQIGSDKDVILDLNGYTLSSAQENVIDVKGKLEVYSTTDNPHTNPDQSQGGRIQPSEDATGNRGIYVREGGSFTLSGGVITGFSGVKYGGGVCADQNVSITIRGGEITGNKAVYGGGIGFCSINTSAPSSFTMTGGKICNNQSEKDGGGVYMGRAFNLQNQILITDGEICENTAGGHGGGVSVDFTSGTDRGSQVTISGGKIHHNTAETDGAGVYIQNCKTVVLGPDLEVSYNMGKGSGGGIRTTAVDEETVENINAHHNRAKSGGGLSLSAGEVLVKDCKIHDNSTRQYGNSSYSGGADLYGTQKLEVQKGEFWLNGAYYGGGLGIGAGTAGQTIIGKEVYIHDNKANDGGGLRI